MIDPARGSDAVRPVYIENGVLSDTPPDGSDCVRLDASGLTLVPGLIDLHVHLREPGDELAETLASGSRAAARGGFTAIVAMPNTQPPVDTIERVRWMRRCTPGARILPSACITLGREGRRPADFRGLAEAGAAAFTDDGSTVPDDSVLETALRACQAVGRPLLDHAQSPEAAARGVIREGRTAQRLGLPGIPPEAETAAVARDLGLAARTDAPLHVQHLVGAESVELLRNARRKGIPVSAEATPHHLALCVDDIPGDDADFKMNPPLGSREDRQALQQAVADGTVEAFATDHAPHTAAAKAGGFRNAPFGVVGLETAVGATFTTLVRTGRMPLGDWVARWTSGPAGILRRPAPCLAPGQPADLAVLDLATEWTVDEQAFLSRSRNTPFRKRRLTGRAVLTLCEGRIAWISDKMRGRTDPCEKASHLC